MFEKGDRSRKMRSVRKQPKSSSHIHKEGSAFDPEAGETRAQQPQHAGKSTPALAAWHNFATFCNDTCGEFTPRSETNQRAQEPIARIEQTCVDLVMSGSQDTWTQLIERHFKHHDEQKVAHDFFYYLSKKHERRRTDVDSPAEVLRHLKIDLAQFVDLAEYAFTTSSNRDLMRLDAIADIIRRYQGSERTFLFLSALPLVVPEGPRAILRESDGFQTILRWGASRFLKDFWYKLQQKFRITRIAIKNEAAQNLARELGETEANLRAQLDTAQTRIAELEQMLAATRAQARQDAAADLARILQNHPNPTLDQIFALHQRLKKEEVTAGGSLSPDSLRVFIMLEGLLEAFRALQITAFPTHVDQAFTLHGNQLGEFSYLEGTPFAGPTDSKTVECVRPGWRVGDVIITPARVKEVAKGD